MIMNLVILESDLEKFLKKMDSLNKKLRKFSSEIRIASHQRGFQTLNTGLVDITFPVVEYFLEIPENNKREDTEFLGTLSFMSGVPMIFSNTDKYNIHELYKESSVCDHCHTSRDRKKWFFFEENGQIKQIGSTCVLEYFGIPLEEILGSFDSEMRAFNLKKVDIDYSSLDEKEIESFKKYFLSSNSFIPASQILGILNYVTNGFSKGWEKGEEGTSRIVKNTIFNPLADAELRKAVQKNTEYEDQIEIIKSYWTYKSTYSNDFEFNIYSNLYSGSVFNASVPYKNIGVVAWAYWKAINNSVKESTFVKEKSEEVTSEFLGNLKERITINGTIKFIKSFPASYGYSQEGESYLYQIITDKGIAKWFSSKDISYDIVWKEGVETDEYGNPLDYYKVAERMRAYEEKLKNEGMKVTLTGTVKYLETFKGQKQTTLTRCKVIKF
jgi:hypothetical protein